MPHHVVIHLPDGRVACANWDDPIVRAMRKVNAQLAQGHRPADPELYVPVADWLDGNREQSASCEAGLSPRGLPCGH